MAYFKTDPELIWGVCQKRTFIGGSPKRSSLSIHSRLPVAPLGAADPLVPEHGHHDPAKPSSGLLQGL